MCSERCASCCCMLCTDAALQTITPSQPITNPETAGWMGLRGEFETEYNNEAEYLLAEMAYTEEDTDTTRELKTRMLEIYYYRLEERYGKRKFILDNGLLDQKKIQSENKKRPKEDRETIVTNNVFMQMLPRPEFDAFMNGLLGASVHCFPLTCAPHAGSLDRGK